MKQIILSSLLLTTLFVIGITQSAAQSAGYKAGTITTDDGTRKEGFIKESFKGKASLQFQSADGKKTITAIIKGIVKVLPRLKTESSQIHKLESISSH